MSELLSGKSGPVKAAFLLLSLPQEESAKVLSHLDDKSIEDIVNAITRIRKISAEEKTEVLEYFQKTIKENKGKILTSQGGIDSAKEILNSAFGDEKAEKILEKINITPDKSVSEDFEHLNTIDDNILINVLLTEHPQTIAITLANLMPKKAANILKSFDKELQKQVAKRLAMTNHTHPKAIAQLSKMLREKSATVKQEEFRQAGGMDALANILNHMDRTHEDNLIAGLDSENPELVSELKEKLTSFEDLGNLTLKELRLLIGELPDNALWALALRGTGEELRRIFFSAMSQNRASDIVDEISNMGPITIREINDAKKRLVDVARRLDEMREIVLKKHREEYVE